MIVYKLFLTIVGIVISGYLSYVALFNSAALACGATGGCHTVQDSTYSEIAEIPISVFGFAMYGTLLIVYILQTNQANSLKDKASANLRQGIRIWPFLIALAGTIYSAYLTGIEAFVLEAWCLWCVTSAVTIWLIFILECLTLSKKSFTG